MRMRLKSLGRIVSVTIVAVAAWAVPAVAQEPLPSPYNIGWVGPSARFPGELYLVQCNGACPSDRLMLVPDPEIYAPGVLTPLGGPYGDRQDVELDRNRLVPAGLPAYSLRVFIFNWNGDEIGAFWLGARPGCTTPEFASGALTGDVDANLSPATPGGRPDALPVPVDLMAYIDAVEAIRPECLERMRNARPLDVGNN